MKEVTYHYVDPTDKGLIVFLIFGIGALLFMLICAAAKGLKLIKEVPTATNFMLSLAILTPICFFIAMTIKADTVSEGTADLHRYLQKNYSIDLSQEQINQLYNNLGSTEIPITRDGKQVVIKLKQVSPDNYTLYEKTADKSVPVTKDIKTKPKSTKTTQPTSKPTQPAKPKSIPEPSPTPFDINNLPPLIPTSAPTELIPSGK